MNELLFPYPSRRSLVYSSRGMVATSQQLAAQAGLDMLKRGGNAVDAAIATAMALCIVEPCSNGFGGDAFVIVSKDDKLYGLNSSGPAPMAISIEKVRAMGHETMPAFGVAPINVPGIPRAWAELSERFGSLPLTELAGPALAYAEDGFPVSAVVAAGWRSAFERLLPYRNDEAISLWYSTYAPKGRAPLPGETWRQKDQARTLRAIAESRARDYYEGEIADKIDAHMKKVGGFLRKEDLAAFKPEWVDPVSVSYRGCEVWELPPNGQGLVALMALNILSEMELVSRDRVSDWHTQIEAMKLAFTDGMRHITDPKAMDVSVAELLSKKLAAQRRGLIGARAIDPAGVRPFDKGTVYLCAADSDGMMVSFIQSNYESFGSFVVVPETGICLQDRGANFSLDPAHANCLAPGKRTYHTIIPGFLTKDGKAQGPFGVMGGFMQPQGHAQVVTNMLDYALNPQAALDAPRWQWVSGRRVICERGVPQHIVTGLADLGHEVEYSMNPGAFGRGQIIQKNPMGGYIGATEPRADGAVAAW
ncbi:MAG: gamma-glutamyltransferase family protein [Clostridiales bacterium]|jgi:gamma-glutamyltranspeptidase/glutathione hydrolase|nr:gamma-glutamyltransferase family protein [Clostridiales bacterium]